jgi:DNA polymerase I-like protein with 3'-5' exonuclease and polymerase domains
MIVLDTETDAIVGNPIANPPVAHGLAYIVPGFEPGYLHWRTEKATHRWSQVCDFLDRIFRSGEPILFHNAPFDIAVLKASFPILPWDLLTWDRIHDTMFQLYLADPYASTLSLKPSAERYLGMVPEERDVLTEWIVSHVQEATRKTAGAYIVRAPVELIAPYAIGDVKRTLAIYEHLKDKVPQEPYDRERRLMPTLFDASKRGIRVARGPLEECLERSKAALDAVDARVRATLQAPGLDPSDSAALVYACESIGMVREDQWIRTPTGEKSTAKGNLELVIPDKDLVALLKYRSSLQTCVSTFMVNWLEMSAGDGRLHPEWNQVRNTEEGKRYGTRTGRLSCSNPNLQNVPTEFNQTIPDGLPDLPFMRQFLLPEEDHFWCKRDFSSQEIRIAAHFEDGPLLEAYKANPDLDPHQMAKEMILHLCHKDFPRKHVKITGFQIIYGGGATAISTNVGCPYHEAQELKNAYFTAMPGLMELAKDTARRGRAGEPITTWGGRKYYREISAKFPGKDFSYKLLNYLIQGSAADQTKQSIIDWQASHYPGSKFLATVHDEINISVPMDEWEVHMEHLRDMMNADRLDCPMKSEGFVGENWHDIEECK